MIAMDEAGLAVVGCGCDQGVGKRKPLLQGAANLERREGHSVVDRHDLVHKLQVILHGAASLLLRGSELAQTPGELGDRKAGGQNLGVTLFEQSLHTSPAGLLPVVCEQGGGVEQVAQGLSLGGTLRHQL